MYFVGYCQIPLHCSFPSATYVSVFPHSPCLMFQGYLHFFFCELSGHLSCSFLKKDFIYLFLERGREREREGEKHQCVVASHMLPLGTWPTTQACALTGNRTGDPLLCSLALNPLSHTSQGRNTELLSKLC